MQSEREKDQTEPLLDHETGTSNDKEEQEVKVEQNTWIIYALIAAVFCTICNAMISEISTLGIECLLYLSPGTVICGTCFFLVMMTMNYRQEGKFRTSMNFKDKYGNFVWGNIGGFFGFCGVYLFYQTIVVMTFQFSNKANVNPGIVSTIWAATPLFTALLDYIFFKQRLTTKHIIGVLCLMTCAVCISLTNVFSIQTNAEVTPTVQAWVPVMLALIAPIGFATSNFQSKYLVSKKGFDAAKLSFLAFASVGLILSVFLLLLPTINMTYLLYGTIGSIANTIGLVFISEACSHGPLGPATALININTLMFAIVSAVKQQRLPMPFEVVGLFVGIFGALVLTIPNHMHSLYKTLTCSK